MNDDRNGELTAQELAEINRLAALLERPTYKSKSQQSDPETQKKARILISRGFSAQVIANTLQIPVVEVLRIARTKSVLTWATMDSVERQQHIFELWNLHMHPVEIQKRCEGLSLVSMRFYLHRAGVPDGEMMSHFPDEFGEICQRPSVAKKHKLKRAYRAKKAQ